MLSNLQYCEEALWLCESNLSWSKQLRQNYGCLTPTSSPKPRLGGRQPHLYAVCGELEGLWSCSLNTSAEVSVPEANKNR